MSPIGSGASIEYGLPATSHVTLNVFDMTGRLVQMVTDGQQAAGVHRTRLDMGTLPSGMYLYRLTAGNQVFTKTLHLIK